MKIEVLMAIRSKGKRDIHAILSSIKLQTDARIAIYHYNGARQETLDYEGHVVNVHYLATGEKLNAYNKLLRLTDADIALFVEPSEKLALNYGSVIADAFVSNPKCDGIVFGFSATGRRLKYNDVERCLLGNMCFKISAINNRGLSFESIAGRVFEAASFEVFKRSFLAWPAKVFGVEEPILTSGLSSAFDEKNHVYLDAYQHGILWPMLSLVRYWSKPKKYRPSLSLHLREASTGYQAYLFRGYEENERIGGSLLPYAVCVISLLGLATQTVLSLLIVFTEVQYIPIWVSLVFLVFFAVIYAFVAPKVRNPKFIFITGLSVGLTSFIVSLVTYLLMKVSGPMATYGAFICAVVIVGITYCFAPSRLRNN